MSLVRRQREDFWKKMVTQPPAEEIDGDVLFRDAWEASVPAESGVYLIRDLRGLLYVGRSSNLRGRFRQHRRHSHNPLLRTALSNPWGELRFAWIVDPKPAALEKRLIEHLRPLCNESQK